MRILLDMAPIETRAEVFRRWKRTLLVIATIYVLGVGGAFGWVVYKATVHNRWRRHVEQLILRLAPKRPTDVTPEQWAQCIHWTWNLHGNYGALGYFPEDQREPFV